jgi:elongation factor G
MQETRCGTNRKIAAVSTSELHYDPERERYTVSESNAQSRPVLYVAISSLRGDDDPRLQRALDDLILQDPTFTMTTELASDQFILRGMDESHLERVCDCILHQYSIPLHIGKPEVIYLETIRKQAEAEGRYLRSGNYGHVKIRLEPSLAGSGFTFVNDIRGGVVPQQYIPPIAEAMQEALRGGVLAGYEIVDVKVTLFDGSYHDFDSNEMAFKIAGSMALKEAARRANPVLLEPVMAVEVVVPHRFMGAVLADLNSRRGRIEGAEQSIDSVLIRALVPLAQMLRSSEHGRPDYAMHFARYEAAAQRGGSDGSGAGVTANKPKGPRAGSDSAAARLDWDFD